MHPKFSGIERGLEKLENSLKKLEPLKERKIEEFLANLDLRNIVAHNLEMVAKCCIDIADRIILLEQAKKAKDYEESILRLGELGVLPMKFAINFSYIVDLRDVLTHSHLDVEWEKISHSLQKIEDIYKFIHYVKEWFKDTCYEE
jgi:uncharacterized protein YutE (UPF0331/DUF86 family)